MSKNESTEGNDYNFETKFKPLNNLIKSDSSSKKRSFFKLVSALFVIFILSSLSIIVILKFKKSKKLKTEEEIEQENLDSIFDEEESKTDMEASESEPTNNKEEVPEIIKNDEQEITEQDTIEDGKFGESESKIAIDKKNIADQSQGMIINIYEPQGYHYVVLSSFIDGDLARDFAAFLKKRGLDAYIIMPKKKKIFHRVCLGQFETSKEAEEHKQQYINTYSSEVSSIYNIKIESIWIYKY